MKFNTIARNFIWIFGFLLGTIVLVEIVGWIGGLGSLFGVEQIVGAIVVSSLLAVSAAFADKEILAKRTKEARATKIEKGNGKEGGS